MFVRDTTPAEALVLQGTTTNDLCGSFSYLYTYEETVSSAHTQNDILTDQSNCAHPCTQINGDKCWGENECHHWRLTPFKTSQGWVCSLLNPFTIKLYFTVSSSIRSAMRQLVHPILGALFEQRHIRCTIFLLIFLCHFSPSADCAGVRKVSSSISCFVCSSSSSNDSKNFTNTDCHDPFNPAMVKYSENCKVPKLNHIGLFPARFCVKVIGKSMSSGDQLVIRACSLESMDNQCGLFKFESKSLFEYSALYV